MRRSRRSLFVRSRILVVILAATAIGLSAAGVASYLVQREQVLSRVDSQLIHTVPELKSIAEGKTSVTPPASVDGVLREAMQQIIPTTNEGVLGFIDGAPALVPAVPMPFRIEKDSALVKRILAEANPTNVVRGTAKSRLGTLRYIIVPIRVAGDSHTGLYVAAYDLDAELGAVANSFQTYVLVALGALVLVGGVFWFVAGKLLRPLRLLREAAAAKTGADLSERIPVSGSDDLSELTRTINGMFDRLEDSFTSQRRLIDDIGHELKTPITIIRGHLELLDTTNARELNETRALVIDELDRMNTLVAEIALLAESRSPQFIDAALVDVEELTDAVAAKAGALDPSRVWHIDAPEPAKALMDSRRITQAWLQLASNAAKYSTAGQPITITGAIVANRTGPWLQFSVADAGPGIPKEAQERVFERFVRLESGRGTEGSGLGLSIVSAIAEAHHGIVLLSSAPGAGSTFTIRIPLRGAVPSASDDGENS
jgi:two-component system OmpR family sensor kinase